MSTAPKVTEEATLQVLPQVVQSLVSSGDDQPFATEFEYYQCIEAIETLHAHLLQFRNTIEERAVQVGSDNFAEPSAEPIENGREMLENMIKILDKCLDKQAKRLEVSTRAALLRGCAAFPRLPLSGTLIYS